MEGLPSHGLLLIHAFGGQLLHPFSRIMVLEYMGPRQIQCGADLVPVNH